MCIHFITLSKSTSQNEEKEPILTLHHDFSKRNLENLEKISIFEFEKKLGLF